MNEHFRISSFACMLGISLALSSHASAAPTLTAIGNRYFVAPINGSSAPVNTEQRWNFKGGDEGSAFTDYTGRTLFLFGDSFGYEGNPFDNEGPDADWRSNLLGRSEDRDPTNGLSLTSFAVDGANHAKQFIARRSGEGSPIPTSGVAVGASLYVEYQRINCLECSSVFGAGIARSDDDGQTWTQTTMWGATSNFVQGALTPPLNGKIYYLATPAGRRGCVRLASVDTGHIQSLSSWTYWTGSKWSAPGTSHESEATCVVSADNNDIGELSVAWNDYLQKWLMLYFTAPGGHVRVEARTSADLKSWSAAVPVQTPVADGWGLGAYAPMLIPSLSSGRDIYFGVSQATTYTMFLVHATLNPGSTSWGPFNVPGHIEAENFETNHDTTATNDTGLTWYRNTNAELVWSGKEGMSIAEAAGEYQKYLVNVTSSGLYRARVKYSARSGCQLQIDAPGTGGAVYVPFTQLNGTGTDDDFETWEPQEAFSLNPGQQYIELYVLSGSCNISYFEIYPDWGTNDYHLFTYPLQIREFSDTPLWIPFSSTANCTVPNTFGTDSSRIANSLFADSFFYQYYYEGNVSCALPVFNGIYSVRMKWQEPSKTAAGQRQMFVDLENSAWLSNYDIFKRTEAAHVARDEIREISVRDGVLNIDISGRSAAVVSALEVMNADPDTYTHPVPGHIEAEDFTPYGAQGSAYSDGNPDNFGGMYRGGGVDIFATQGGGYQVGLTGNGEWMKYDLDVTANGTYKIRVHYAGGACRLRIEAPGGKAVYVPATSIPGTADSNTFTTWEPANTFSLTKGRMQMSLFFSTGGCDIDWFDIYPINCTSTVCCATTCKNAAGDYQCGGTGCSAFSGGSDRCCTQTIAAANYSCGGDPLTNAPCVLP
jgi:hypothetical protein